MIKAMPSETITIVIGEEPRRWKGVYTTRLSSTDTTEQATMATSMATHTDTPSWLIQYATNAPAVMTAANARLSTSVTANCSVNPTDAIASTAAVMSPNPIDAAKMLMAGYTPSGPSGRRRTLPERPGWLAFG